VADQARAIKELILFKTKSLLLLFLISPMPSLFRPEAIEHQRNRLFGEALIVWPVPLKWIVFAAVLAAALFVAFAIWGDYTRKVHVTGFLAPTEGFVKVHTREVGTVTERRVQEGQAVKKGDVLFVLSLDRGGLSGLGAGQVAASETRRRREALLQEKSRLLSIGRSQTDQLQKRMLALSNEYSKIEGEIALQRKRVESFRSTVQRYQQLLAENFISPTQHQQQTALLLEQEVLLGSLERNKFSIAREIDAAKQQLPEISLRSQNDLSAIERQLSSLEQDLAEIDARREIIVVAPIDGTATAIQAQVGQIANPATPLLSVLPAASALQARLLAPAAAVGFIEPGKAVNLRYAAYPYQRFGHQRGWVQHVSKTIVTPAELLSPIPAPEPFYLVTVLLERQDLLAYGKPFALQAGMTLEADVLLDKRPLYHWVLEPLFSIKGRV